MHPHRTSTALRQLGELHADPEPSRWAWAIATPDPHGRLRLPAEARTALQVRAGERQELRGICHRAGLVVRPAGNGAVVVVDSRGRLTLPVWLRGDDDRALLIGSAHGSAMVVVAPVAVLAAFGDLLAGGAR